MIVCPLYHYIDNSIMTIIIILIITMILMIIIIFNAYMDNIADIPGHTTDVL